MPLTGITYTKTGTFLPTNASTPITHLWTVDGTIISGQGTANVSYQFNTAGTRAVTYAASNSCSNQSNSQSFTVCDPITGLTISGPSSMTVGVNAVYTATVTTGSPTGYSWSDTSNNVSIVSGQGTSSVTISASASGTFTLNLAVTDCDGIAQNTSLTITAGTVLCIALTSCSF